MQKNELELKLVQKNIPSDLYSLKAGLPNEAYCLNEQDGHWEVYYSERGIKSSLKTFSSESEACEYFYENLIEMLKGGLLQGFLIETTL